MAGNTTDWQAGVQLLKQGKTAEAIEALRAATGADPSCFEAHMYLGMALAQTGQAAAGAESLLQAVSLKPESAVARYNLGCALERAGDDTGAADAFDEAVRLDPAHAKAQQARERAQSRLAAGALQPAEPAPAQPAAAAPPPKAEKPKAKSKPARAAAKSGSRAKLLVPLAAVVVLGGAAAAYLLLFASTPTKTATQYLTAMQAQKYADLAPLCTKDSQSLIDGLKSSAQRQPKLTKFEVGAATKQRSEATVQAKVTLELPSMFGQPARPLELELPVILSKEGLQWKVSLQRTQEEASKAFVATVRKLVPPALQNLLDKALGKAFSKGGAPPQ